MSTLDQRFVPIGRRVVRVLAGGTGTPLVLVLASPVVSADLYRRPARCLAGHVRVAVVDLPGAGLASRVRRPLGTDELADCVPGLLDALDAPSAVVVGHSNSGPIALLAGLRHRSRVRGLVLTGSAGAHPRPSLWPVAFGRAMDALLEPRLTLTGWPPVLRNLFRHTRSFIDQVPRAAGDAWLPAAAALDVPTLLAWGRRDHTMPLQAAARLHRAIARSTLVVSGTGSHDWIIEQPQRFTDALLAWMRDQRMLAD